MSEDKEPKFEEALSALEAIIAGLESGTVPLAQSVEAFEKGTQLLAFCQKTLKAAQMKVHVLEESMSQEA